MTSAPRSAALLIALLACGAADLTAQNQPRTLFASILDSKGAPVLEISPSDVIVREDKIQREVLRVSPADEPMQVALLVDNSQAAEPRIRDYREALPALISGILGDPHARAKHQISIVTMAERPTINTDYTSDEALLRKGAGRIFSMAGSGTYLLDAILEVSQGIAKRGAVRPVIVVVTTEGPDLSYRQYQQVLEKLKVGGAQLHVVTLGTPVVHGDDRNIVVAQGPRDSGGSYDNLLTSMALKTRLEQLAAELTSQFSVTYSRPQSLIPPERVTVTAAKPGLTVRGTPAVVPLAERP